MVYFTPETTPGLGQTAIRGPQGLRRMPVHPRTHTPPTVPLALSTKGLCLVPPAMNFPTQLLLTATDSFSYPKPCFQNLSDIGLSLLLTSSVTGTIPSPVEEKSYSTYADTLRQKAKLPKAAWHLPLLPYS